jgi:hypothetical protein
MGSTSTNVASSFCDSPDWRSSQIRITHCARVIARRRAPSVDPRADQPRHVDQQEQKFVVRLERPLSRGSSPSGYPAEPRSSATRLIDKFLGGFFLHR